MLERTEPPSVDNLSEARRAIEAVLLVANDPTPVQLLAQLVELPVDLVQSMCRELAGEYEADRRGFQLVEVAGGWRYQTHPDTHPYVERFALEGVPNRLSSAALETLAIVAYKQPISRAQIGAIRGVNVEGVLRTLTQRGYVDEQGRDDGPGQATLFGTTPFFLEQLGLMSLDDLPPLGDFVPSVEVLEALENTLRVDPEITVDPGEPEATFAPDADPGPETTASNGSANGVGTESVNGASDQPPTFEIMSQAGPSDELEVAADPEVDMTDGTIATGAAGVDDARFPGARSAPPAAAGHDLDPGQDPAGEPDRLGPSSAEGDDRPPSSPRWSPAGPETLTNGHRSRPDDRG